MLFHNTERLKQVVFGVMYDIRYIHLTDCNKKQIFTQKTKTFKLQIPGRNLYAKTDKIITVDYFGYYIFYTFEYCVLAQNIHTVF